MASYADEMKWNTEWREMKASMDTRLGMSGVCMSVWAEPITCRNVHRSMEDIFWICSTRYISHASSKEVDMERTGDKQRPGIQPAWDHCSGRGGTIAAKRRGRTRGEDFSRNGCSALDARRVVSEGGCLLHRDSKLERIVWLSVVQVVGCGS